MSRSARGPADAGSIAIGALLERAAQPKLTKGVLSLSGRLRGCRCEFGSQIYFRKRHPLFHRWTRQLALLERLRQPLRWEEWGDCLGASIRDAAELDAHLDGARIVAWSPSPMMIPAAFRPLSASAVSFTPEDWQLLEPGRYMLALAHPALPGKLRYLSFERAAGSG